MSVVVRADLLPHREEVQFIVPRSFGIITSFCVNVKNLEKVEFENLDALGKQI
jgi:hypothetical protein